MLSENNYISKYKDNTILIKVSGSQIVGDKSKKLIWDIKELLFANINIILVFGWWQQIDKEWNKYSSKERPKLDGVGITSLEVLEYWVKPAYSSLVKQLENTFQNYLYNVVSPENVICETDTKFGLVGKVSQVKWINNSKQLNIIWFMGENNGQKLNVNADEIAQRIIFQQWKYLSNVVFVSSLSGLLDKQWNHVPLVASSRIPQILENKDEEIEVNNGMIKKLKETSIILKYTNRVVFLDSDSLLDEITTWQWAGTLFLNLEDIKLEKLKNLDRSLIRSIYYNNISRDSEIKQKYNIKIILDNHYVVKVNWVILWWVSILQNNDKLNIDFIWSSQQKWKFIDKIYNLAEKLRKKKLHKNAIK